MNEGFQSGSRSFSIKVHRFICDAPAKAYIKCIKTHSGYSSCDRYTGVGEYINGRVVLRGINSQKEQIIVLEINETKTII